LLSTTIIQSKGNSTVVQYKQRDGPNAPLQEPTRKHIPLLMHNSTNKSLHAPKHTYLSFTTAWGVLGLRMEETASRYGG